MMTASPTPSEPTASDRDGTGRFAPGQSGNPSGRPKGTRNRLTIQMGRTLAEKASDLAKSIAAQALDGGDAKAARVMIDMIAAAEEHDALQEIAQMPTACRTDIEALASRIAQFATEGAVSPVTAGRLLDVLQKTADLLPRRRAPKKAAASGDE